MKIVLFFNRFMKVEEQHISEATPQEVRDYLDYLHRELIAADNEGYASRLSARIFVLESAMKVTANVC